MSTIVIDFETHFDSDYTLRDMPTASYINDERFEVLGVGVWTSKTGFYFKTGTYRDVRQFLWSLNWTDALVVAHNAQFDGAILEWKFGIKPYKYFCTMMGARPWVTPFIGSMSLNSVAAWYGVGTKATGALPRVKGLRRAQIQSTDWSQLAAYCIQDVRLTAHIATSLLPNFPTAERDLIDLTVKKFTRPSLKLDPEPLKRRLDELEEHKAKALVGIGHTDPKVLRSNPQFAKLLGSHGVNPPTKISETTGKQTWAFSKQDREFMALRDHPVVGRFVEARLLFKSSIEHTRIERLLDIAAKHNNWLAAPLLYGGAHTIRYSGMDGINLQNLPRGSVLREAIVAPEGHVIVAADLSQIEARILATLAGQEELRQAFANKQDVYSLFASRLYGRTVTKDTDPGARFVGKTAILSLGYQAGAEKFHDSMHNFGVSVDMDEAKRVVNTYRTTYPAIPRLWSTMELAISAMSHGQNPMRVGPVLFDKEHMRLPNKMKIYYPALHRDRSGRYTYMADAKRRFRTDLYGGKLTENVVQALARIVMTTAELRLAQHGLRAALSVHDELVFVAPEQHADKVARAIKLSMEAPVPWLPDLPVECEIKVGENYKECK